MKEMKVKEKEKKVKDAAEELEPRETTSLRIRPSVYRELKVAAIRRNEDVAELVEDLMIRFLNSAEGKEALRQ